MLHRDLLITFSEPKCIHKPETRKKRLPSPFASFVRKKNKHYSFVVFPVSNHPPLIFVIIVVISAFSYFFSYSHIFTSAIVGIIKFLISRSSSSSLITITRVSRPQISLHLSLSIPFLYFFYLLLGTSLALALEYHE